MTHSGEPNCEAGRARREVRFRELEWRQPFWFRGRKYDKIDDNWALRIPLTDEEDAVNIYFPSGHVIEVDS